MSEITKPIALDESLHTTEQTPRNLADVLSDELQNLATAISGGSDKVPKTDIATVEPTNTASRAYSVGELVYVNGNLYKVITAITIGATFTVGTNIQSTTVSGTVKDALNKAGKYTKLWENADPSASFAAQTITLSSDDYDLLLCIHLQGSVTVKKGQAIHLSSTVATATTMGVRRRIIDYVSDTSLSVRDNYYASRSGNTDSYAVQNDGNVPLVVYGIKL